MVTVRRGILKVLLLAYGLGGAFVNAAEADSVRLLALGDSLTAGFGLPEKDSFPSQLEDALRASGLNVEVINGGVSGDTTAGGLARLDWALADRPDAVLVCLGANDALRGLSPQTTYSNLDRLLTRLEERGVPVLLAGMRAPYNFGTEYGNRFDAIYPKLAKKHGIPLYPFFLEGVITVPELNQMDGLHPNDRGVRVVVKGLLPQVKTWIEPLTRRGEASAR